MHSLPTPAFLINLSTLRRNAERMREKARAVGFRPHVKTHKAVEIGRVQHGGGIGPITVSTLAEAEFFADGGFRDITYAFPIAPEKLARAGELARRIDRLNLLIDNEAALRALEAFHRAQGVVFDVFLKVDCGYHRAGVDPASPDAARLALAMADSPALRFHGLLTHAGHSYDAKSRDEILRIAAEETSSLTRFRALLGLESLTRSVGSTPTLSMVESFVDCDEVRPGNYIFYDAFQASIGACELRDCAVSVLSTVVGSYPERNAMIVDAGALAMSKDHGAGENYGVVCDLDLNPLPMKLAALSQEHGKIQTESPLPVGAQVRIIPNHSCLTSAMFDVFQVVDDEGRVVDQWKPARGW